MSGSASLLSGSLSKIFKSFLTHPNSCLLENEKPKSLKVFSGIDAATGTGVGVVKKEDKKSRKQSGAGTLIDKERDRDRDKGGRSKKTKSTGQVGDSGSNSSSNKTDRCVEALLEDKLCCVKIRERPTGELKTSIALTHMSLSYFIINSSHTLRTLSLITALRGKMRRKKRAVQCSKRTYPLTVLLCVCTSERSHTRYWTQCCATEMWSLIRYCCSHAV